MNGKRLFSLLSAGLVLALLSGIAYGQETAGPVGTGFTYQGQLKSGGLPYSGACDLRFKLFDLSTGGSQVGLTQTKNNTPLESGIFTVQLDFGSSAFPGDARWLDIAVCCPTGGCSWTALAPRQPLTAAPYALSLRPGANILGVLNGAVVTIGNSSDATFGAGVLGVTSSPYQDSVGVWGLAGAGTGATYGVRGESISTSGTGVYGVAGAATGNTYGVYGEVSSTNGDGVYGIATGVNGTGVHGEANRYAVTGTSTATTGPAHGVGGVADSDAGSGIFGYATSHTGNTFGASAQADSTAGIGVQGYASAATGTTYGVHGVSDSTSGRAVAGHANATSGLNYGVLGVTSSAAGYGVYYIGGLGGVGLDASIVDTQGSGWRKLYSMASPDVLFEDVGTARLVDGQAVVAIDPVFAQTVNLEQPYQVFLTAQGEAPVVLWVKEKTAASFTVGGVSLDGAAAACSFDYRLVAKRLGYEDVRLAPAADPPQIEDDVPQPATVGQLP